VLKVLNLYAGIGGNRQLWPQNIKVTAVEYDPAIASIYADLFRKDELIIGDAHDYLLNHYQDFDLIWTSPPCQSHSSFRFNIGVRYRGVDPVYPDMSLYQEILLLKTHYKGKWVVENVKPYYKPLIDGYVEVQRHLFWSNCEIKPIVFPKDNIRSAQIPDLEQIHGYDLSAYKLSNKRQVLRNCVYPPLGEYVFNQMLSDPRHIQLDTPKEHA